MRHVPCTRWFVYTPVRLVRLGRSVDISRATGQRPARVLLLPELGVDQRRRVHQFVVSKPSANNLPPVVSRRSRVCRPCRRCYLSVYDCTSGWLWQLDCRSVAQRDRQHLAGSRERIALDCIASTHQLTSHWYCEKAGRLYGPGEVYYTQAFTQSIKASCILHFVLVTCSRMST